MPRGLPAHARDLRGKARGVRLHAGTTGPASPKSGCGRGPADAGGFGLRMKSRPSKRCFPAKHKLCQCKFFLLFPQKAILTLSIRDRACLQSKGAVSCLRYNARFYFFFLFSPCMFAFFAGPGKSPAQPPAAAVSEPPQRRSVFRKEWGRLRAPEAWVA